VNRSNDGVMPVSDKVLRLNNEFTSVIVALDHSRNGARLRIESVRTGRVVYFDPMQLEAMTWMPEELILRQFEYPFGPED